MPFHLGEADLGARASHKVVNAVMCASKNMHLNFRPNIDLISSTRRFVNELMDSMISNPDASSRVALTIHELLENTLKYSTDGEARLDVSVQRQEGRAVVEVSASNRATPEQLQELQQRIDELREVADPMGLYVSMMVDSARRDGSGLGLVRIRVEGEMDVTYAIDGDRITIKCSTPVEG